MKVAAFLFFEVSFFFESQNDCRQKRKKNRDESATQKNNIEELVVYSSQVT